MSEKSPVNSAEVKAGVAALMQHHQTVQEAKARGTLMDDGTVVSVQFALRNIPPARVRPVAM